MAVRGIEPGEGPSQMVEGPAQDCEVVARTQVGCQGSGRRQLLEILREDLATAPSAFAALHVVEETLEAVVRPVHEADATAGAGRERDCMAEEAGAVPFEVSKDDVDGLALVLGRASFGAALGERGCKSVEGGLDVSKLGGGLFRGEHGRGPLVPSRRLGSQTEGIAQLGEDRGAGTQGPRDLLEGNLAVDRMEEAPEPLEGSVEPTV